MHRSQLAKQEGGSAVPSLQSGYRNARVKATEILRNFKKSRDILRDFQKSLENLFLPSLSFPDPSLQPRDIEVLKSSIFGCISR